MIRFPVFPLLATLAACGGKPDAEAPAPKPSLVVTTTAPVARSVERAVTVSGSVGAWQEMSLGVELAGVRVAQVLVEVGDVVRSGQPLVRLDTRTLNVQARQADASVAQARAALELARANATRGDSLFANRLISSSDYDKLRADLIAAEAGVATAEANREEAQLRLSFATLSAPDAGVISARNVQPGQVVSAGAELLRLIRQGRLEWRAELAEADLARVRVGTPVELVASGGQTIAGKVRAVSPAISPDTRTGLLYADLDTTGELRAGMFMQGRIMLGSAESTVLPRESIVVRDGYPYVFVASPRADAGNGERLLDVKQRRITVGAQQDDYTVITAGLEPAERVVVRGAAFLGDGDVVREVPPPAVANKDLP